MVTNLLGGNFTVKPDEPQLTAVYPLNFYVTTAPDGENHSANHMFPEAFRRSEYHTWH